MRVKAFTTIAVVTISVAAAAGCGSESSSSSDTTTGSSSTQANGPIDMEAAKTPFTMATFEIPSPEQAAKALGYLDDLDVDMKPIDSAGSALQLLVSGDLAGMSNVGVPPMAIAANNDIPLKIVWYQGLPPAGLYVRPEIQSPEDLEGKKIGSPGGSFNQALLVEYLEENGGNGEYVSVPPDGVVGAYKSGQIDGAAIWSPIANQLEDAGAHKLEDQAVPTYTVFSGDFVEDHPDAVQAYVCAMAKAQTTAEEDPKEVFDALAKELGSPVSTVEDVWPTELTTDQANPTVLGTPGSPPQEAVDAMVGWGDLLAQQEVVPASPDPERIADMFDPTFAEGVTAGRCPK